MRALALLVAASAGCASLVGIDDFTLDDAGGPTGDAGPIPPSIQITGVLQRRTTSSVLPVENATVKFARTDRTILATETSGVDGIFTILVPTDGAPVNGYVEVTASGAFAARTFVVNKTTDVANLPVTLFDNSVVMSFASNSGVTQSVLNACLVVDTLVEAATVTSTVGEVRYVDAATGQPSFIRAATDTSGLAWVFSIPTGNVTVSASLLGVSFASRTVPLEAGTCGRATLDIN